MLLNPKTNIFIEAPWACARENLPTPSSETQRGKSVLHWIIEDNIFLLTIFLGYYCLDNSSIIFVY